jgi:hypothetical protein
VVFAYSYWINNSVQALGNSLLLSVISRITSAIGGLGSLGTFGDEADLDNPFNTIGNAIFGRGGGDGDPSYNGSDYGSEDSGFFSWFGADEDFDPLIITNDDDGFALPGVGRQDGIYTDPYDRGIYWG